MIFFGIMIAVGFFSNGLASIWISIGNAMIAGIIIVPIVSLISPKMDKEKLDEIFICLEEKVLVSKCKSIEE